MNFIPMVTRAIILILLLFVSSTAFSESYIRASSGIIWDKNNKLYSATGDVEFKNSEITAYADNIDAYYKIENDKEIFEVVILNKDVEILYNDEIFKAEKGNYNRSKSLINLFGNVEIISPDRYLSGDELIVDLDKNTRVLKTNGENKVAEALIKDE